MSLRQVHTLLNSGMNSDDSLEIMPLGDSPTTYVSPGRMNVIVPPDNYGKLEDAWGTTLVAATSRDLGGMYMGHAIDTDRKWCYYFLTNTGAGSDSHSIIGVSIEDGSSVRVVMENEDELELDSSIIFKKAPYIDGWVYWASGQYGPKKIHIERAMNFTLYKSSAWDSTESYDTDDVVLYTDGGIYTCLNDSISGTPPPLDETNWTLSDYAYPNTASGTTATLLDGAFDLVELPPTTSVTGEYGDDTSRLYNNLRGRMFQFTYRWKYRNGGYSNTAPFSELFLPPDVESYNGEILNSFATNNVLTLYLDGGDEPLIEYVELYVRMGKELSWQYVDKIDAGTNTYSFYNDYIMEVADDDTVNKLDNYIPKETRALELLSENVLALGGNTYGFDNVTPDVALDVGWEQITLGETADTEDVEYVIPASYNIGNGYLYHEITVADVTDLDAGDILHIYLKGTKSIVERDYVIQLADIGDAETWGAKVMSLINEEGDSYLFASNTYPPVGMTLTNGDFYIFSFEEDGEMDYLNSYIKVYAPSGSNTISKRSQFTTGARHVFGITYFDRAMRPFAVAANDDTKIYVPTVVEAYVDGELYSSTEYEHKNYISWEILHEAPADAKYWQWFYAGCNIEDFWFYAIDSVSATAGVLSIVMTSLQGVQTDFPLSQIGPYTWQKGDRIRCITKIAASEAYGSLADSAIDLEIKAFDEDTSTFTLETTGTDTYDFGAGSLIEIYRPQTTVNDDLFFAFGPIYETYVYSAEVYHKGETQDQYGTSDNEGAQGTFDEGDSYIIARAFPAGLVDGSAKDDLFLVESKSYSDFYDSDWYSQGKINIRSNIGEVELNNIALSNKLIQDTGINGLCTFEATDVVSLPDKNGQINVLRQIGNVLRVIQQRKRTSFYVGMTEFYNQDGTASLVASSEILGNARELDGDWGTEHPETVIQVNDMLFFWDIHNRAFVQDSENGAYPVSDNKMKQFFIELGDDIMSAVYFDAYYSLECDYEPLTQTIYFSYYYQQGQTGIVLYHLPSKRWVSYLVDETNSQLYLTGFIRASNRFFWVYNGKLYEMTSTAERRRFSGAATRSTGGVAVVGNTEPLIPKTIDTVGVISNQHTGWSVTFITIPADATTKVDQESWVIDEDWKTREGVTRAPVKRNVYTSGVYKYSDLWEGERMRGRVVLVAFVLPVQTTGKVEITALEIGMSSK